MGLDDVRLYGFPPYNRTVGSTETGAPGAVGYLGATTDATQNPPLPAQPKAPTHRRTTKPFRRINQSQTCGPPHSGRIGPLINGS